MNTKPAETKIPDNIRIRTLKNGLTVIVEPMPDFESVALELHIPGGITHDDERHLGACLLLAELSTRGVDGLSSEELSNEFDARGIRHSEAAGHDRFVYRASLLSEHLGKAMDLVSRMVLTPTLPEDEVDDIRSILLQDIAALQDNPSRRAVLELAGRYYPDPYNRPGVGTEAGLKACDAKFLRGEFERLFKPGGSVLSVAGRCDPEEVFSLAERQFGAWTGTGVKRQSFGKLQPFTKHHLQEDSAQLQIVLNSPSAPFGSPHYYAAKLAVQVLSGGMFGRLFIEVREKRGLVYSVHASHSAALEYGTLSAYAGTTPERAHETLDVLVAEMKSLKGSASAVEIKRAQANLKASLILGQEPPGARSSANLHDFWLTGRIRSNHEIVQAIQAVDAKTIDACLEAYPIEPFTLVTLGARAL